MWFVLWMLACGSPDADACIGADGEGHAVGDTWAEDCNTCECTPEGASCTEMGCVDDEAQ